MTAIISDYSIVLKWLQLLQFVVVRIISDNSKAKGFHLGNLKN